MSVAEGKWVFEEIEEGRIYLGFFHENVREVFDLFFFFIVRFIHETIIFLTEVCPEISFDGIRAFMRAVSVKLKKLFELQESIIVGIVVGEQLPNFDFFPPPIRNAERHEVEAVFEGQDAVLMKLVEHNPQRPDDLGLQVFVDQEIPSVILSVPDANFNPVFRAILERLKSRTISVFPVELVVDGDVQVLLNHGQPFLQQVSEVEESLICGDGNALCGMARNFYFELYLFSLVERLEGLILPPPAGEYRQMDQLQQCVDLPPR